MAAVLHFDCASGLAGDMFLGACLDLGMPIEAIAEPVARLGFGSVDVEARGARRGGVEGTRFRVLVDGQPLEGPDPGEPAGARPAPAAARGWIDFPELLRRVRAAGLPPPVATLAEALLGRYAAAAAAATGKRLDGLCWGRLQAIDLLVDLVGAAGAVDWLAPSRITCGRVYLGGGRGPVGRRPAPGPVTRRLLDGVPDGVPVATGDGGELLTPTGAVLLSELVGEYRDRPSMEIRDRGHGLGRAELPGRANVFVLWRGRPAGGGA